MIGLMTENFLLYYDLVSIMKRRNIPFASLSFKEEIPPNVDVILTSIKEKDRINFDRIISCEVNSNLDDAIDKAILLSYGKNEIIIGIDPGKNIGVAIFGGEKLIRSFTASTPEAAARHIIRFVNYGDIQHAVVRIGNGARIIRNRIINLLQNPRFKIEIVDENEVVKANDDEKAAMHIAMMEGKEINGKMEIIPKKGEIKEMQRLSRIKSKNITISKKLAKMVLIGKITLEEAIERQKNHE